MLSLVEDHMVTAEDSRTLATASGAYAELVEAPDGESLKVYSNEQKLLFEYDPVSGRTSVYVPTGDLEFVTGQGDIIFSSARGISLRGQTVHLTSGGVIRLAITDMIGSVVSAVTLQSRRMKLTSPEVAVTAQRGELCVEEGRYTAKKLLGRAGHAKFIIGRLETLADSVVEKAKNVYQTVEGLLQQKAGRLRTLVDSTYHFKSNKAFLRTEEDFKVKAEKIHLG